MAQESSIYIAKLIAGEFSTEGDLQLPTIDPNTPPDKPGLIGIDVDGNVYVSVGDPLDWVPIGGNQEDLTVDNLIVEESLRLPTINPNDPPDDPGLIGINNNKLYISTSTQWLQISGDGTNPFDQNLNKTDSVTFAGVKVNGQTETDTLKLNSSKIALGSNAGLTNQGGEAIAIGEDAGFNDQPTNGIAIGISAGSNGDNTTPKENTIAIGTLAGQNLQSSGSIAIGAQAGNLSLNIQAVAIGQEAGFENTSAGSVYIGAGSGANGGDPNNNPYTNVVVINADSDGDPRNVNALNPSANDQIRIKAGDTELKVDSTGYSFTNGGNPISGGTGLFEDLDVTDLDVTGSLDLPDIDPLGTPSQAGLIGVEANTKNVYVSAGTSPGPFTWEPVGNTPTDLTVDNLTVNDQLTVNSDEIALGSNAGSTNQGNNSVAVGNGAGRSNQPTNGIAIGLLAGSTGNATTQKDTIAVGRNAGESLQSSNSIAIGTDAGTESLSSQAVAIGQEAGFQNTSARSVYIGAGSGANGGDSNNDAYTNVVVISANAAFNPSDPATGANPTANDQIRIKAGSTELQADANGYSFTSGGNPIPISGGTGSFQDLDVTGSLDLPDINLGVSPTQAGLIGVEANTKNVYVSAGTSPGPFTWEPVGNTPTDLTVDNLTVNDQLTVNSDEIALGSNAGSTNQGNNSVAIGNNAGVSNLADKAVAIGLEAGYENSSANSIYIGQQAGLNGGDPDNNDDPYTDVVVMNAGSGVLDPTADNQIRIKAGDTELQADQARIALQSGNKIALGSGAGSTDQGANSVAVGNSAGSNTQGDFAVAVGRLAGNDNQKPDAVAIGAEAGSNTQGERAVAVGRLAGNDNQNPDAVAIGANAGNDTQGDNAVAVGNFAGKQNQGARSIAIGKEAGLEDSSANSIYIGERAGLNGDPGGTGTPFANVILMNADSGSTGSGGSALNPTADNQIRIKAGTTELQADQDRIALQSGSQIALGSSAGSINQGNDSVAVGLSAGRQNQGSFSVAIGPEAGIDNQGDTAVAVGDDAGRNNQGTKSVAIGKEAGSTSQGEEAVAIGYLAGQGSQEPSSPQGDRAVAVGTGSGFNGQGQDAVAVGHDAGGSSQGQNSVAIGLLAGNTNQGENSIAIGKDAGQQNSSANSIYIGAGAGIDGAGGTGTPFTNVIVMNASNSTLNPSGNDEIRINAGTTTLLANSTGLSINGDPVTTTEDLNALENIFTGKYETLEMMVTEQTALLDTQAAQITTQAAQITTQADQLAVQADKLAVQAAQLAAQAAQLATLEANFAALLPA